MDQRRRNRRENPSFSSILLDAIYRSIDETTNENEEQLILYKETMKRKQNTASGFPANEETANFQRACMIEKWIGQKKTTNRRNSTTDFDRKTRNGFPAMNSSSSSSESEFSKPTRAWNRFKFSNPQTFEEQSSLSIENSFVKTKSKASKIHHDLKKVKQPLSPGARLASFLNSLFNGGNPKTKQKVSNSMNYDEESSRKSKNSQGSTCSSASSFSRSCLSKTPSSRGKLGDTKRSVRFCPVSVIFDEDCRPCGHKSLNKEEPEVMAAIEALKKPSKSLGKFEKVNGEVFKSYQYQRKNINGNEAFDNEDEDDAVSCSSSDLFELDNLSVIGIGRYQEELPVYETTHFDTNCAIANGMIL